MSREGVLAVDLETQKAWAWQWREAGKALAEVRHAELRALTAEQALAASDDLLSLSDRLSPPSARWTTSGLVEQQRLLQRGRR
jgi:hypothetical protein